MIKLLRQSTEVSMYWGAAKDLVMRVLVYVNILSLTLALPAYYAILKPLVPWLSVKLCVVVFLAVFILAGVIELKYLAPSMTKWVNYMTGRNASPVMAELAELRKELAELKSMLKEVVNARKERSQSTGG